MKEPTIKSCNPSALNPSDSGAVDTFEVVVLISGNVERVRLPKGSVVSDVLRIVLGRHGVVASGHWVAEWLGANAYRRLNDDDQVSEILREDPTGRLAITPLLGGG